MRMWPMCHACDVARARERDAKHNHRDDETLT